MTAMTTPAGNRPVIFLGHEDYLSLLSRHRENGGNPDKDVFEPKPFSQGDWMRLLALSSHQVINFMLDPLDPLGLTDIWETHRAILELEAKGKGKEQLSFFVNEDPLTKMLREQDDDNAISIYGLQYNVMRSFIANLPKLPPLFFRARYNPTRNELEAHIRLVRGHGAEPEDIAAQMVQSGTWTFSSISGFDIAVADQLTHPKIPAWLAEGARILVVSNSHNVLARPEFLPMGQSEDGRTEFWKPKRPGAGAEGAQIELIHSGNLIERFHIKQIRALFRRAYDIAKKAGRRPAIVFDIDGTVANARGFTLRVFEEFVDMYARLAKRTPGPLPDIATIEDELPAYDMQASLKVLGVHDNDILGLAQGYLDFKMRESPSNDYDAATALREFVAVLNAISPETAERLRSTYETYKLDHKPNAWNNVEMLKKLGVTDQYLLALAAAHFEHNFFAPVRRLDKEPIEGTVQFIRMLQNEFPDLVTIALTLRDAHDDNLPDGRSSSEVWFRKIGIWNENSVLVRLEKRSFINFSADAFKAGGNEPNKGELLQNHLSRNPDVHPAMLFENDPRHANDLLRLFPYQILVVRVDAEDMPPHSPEDSNGIFVLRADQLRETLRYTLEPELAEELNRKAITIKGEAWEPMMARWHAAVAAGIQPAVVFDIDDTLLMTSNRSRMTLENYLKEVWLPSHPEHDWTLDVIQGFTMSQVEYGIPAMLKASGLDGLGPEFEKGFTVYFLKNFLSNAYLGEDIPRLNAVAFVKKLHDMGTRIIYLTGRTQDDMGEGTIAALRDAGFPLDGASAELVMREDHNESDFDFKARVLKETIGSGDLIALLDNEPENLIRTLELAPGVAVYLVGDKHTSNAPRPPAEAIPIADFSGKIGPPQPRQKPMIGEVFRKKGADAAREFIHQLNMLYSDFNLMYGYGADHIDHLRSSMRENANMAAAMLGDIIALHPSHPVARAFIERINKFIRTEKKGLVHFDDLLNLVSSNSGRSFTTIQGPEGIERMIDAKQGIPADLHTQPLPPSFSTGPMSLDDAVQPPELEKRIMTLDQGPKLSAADQAGIIDSLSFGVYPRLEAVLKSVIAEMAKLLGVAPEFIRAIEYGPRRAIAAIALLRRMGVNVMYREPALIHRLQTEAELSRLPAELREGVRHIPNERAAAADIAIWNLPPHHVDLKEMTRDVNGSTPKALVVQSDQRVGQELEHAAAQQGWAPVMSMQLPPQQYIMPTAFMHVAAPTAPLMFQIFRPVLR